MNSPSFDSDKVLGGVDTRYSVGVRRETINTLVIVAICVVLVGLSRFVAPGLGSGHQILTVLVLSTFLVVVTFGQGLVVLVGGLDLSIGAVVTLGGVITGALSSATHGGAWYIVPVVLAACGLVGFVSALGVALVEIPAFIMTLAVALILDGAILGGTGGTPPGLAPDGARALMTTDVLHVPLAVIFLVLFIVFGWLLQERSVLGRYMYAMGNSSDAARIAGVPRLTAIALPYVISAMCSGFVGYMLVGYANGASLGMGHSYVLPTIAAVVVGGSSILGGRGSFLASVAGAFLLSILENIIQAMGMNIAFRTIIEGAIIIAALIILRERAAGKSEVTRWARWYRGVRGHSG